MTKKLFGLMVIMLFAAFFISGCGKKVNNKPAGENQNQNNEQAAATVNPSGEYTINELLTMNKPLKCSWKENATNSSEVTNIIYINGKKFYQDVTMGDLGHAYTISDGEYLYIWNDFSGTASKMKYDEIKTNANQAPVQGNTGAEQKHDFICENWSVDNSVFIPPQDKNFKDVSEEMSQAMQQLPQNSGNYKQQICAMCDQAPTQELKDSCRKNSQCE